MQSPGADLSEVRRDLVAVARDAARLGTQDWRGCWFRAVGEWALERVEEAEGQMQAREMWKRHLVEARRWAEKALAGVPVEEELEQIDGAVVPNEGPVVAEGGRTVFASVGVLIRAFIAEGERRERDMEIRGESKGIKRRRSRQMGREERTEAEAEVGEAKGSDDAEAAGPVGIEWADFVKVWYEGDADAREVEAHYADSGMKSGTDDDEDIEMEAEEDNGQYDNNLVSGLKSVEDEDEDEDEDEGEGEDGDGDEDEDEYDKSENDEEDDEALSPFSTPCEEGTPIVGHQKTYRGHCNVMVCFVFSRVLVMSYMY